MNLMRPMTARSADEPHRAATPLELFFDLVIVVAIAVAASEFHHGIADDHIPEALLAYGLTFFAIWWTWMTFTWFAAAYDTDDVPYRVSVFVQMAGAIIITAGIADAFDIAAPDWSQVALGYVVMRVAVVGQWLRAGRQDAARRALCYRYALGVTVLQVGWVLLVLAAPADLFLVFFAILAAGELAVPIWAQRATPGDRYPFHPDHIAERYGLLTIIVLGESVLAGAIAFGTAGDVGFSDVGVLAVATGSLLLVFSMWWLYFERPTADLLTSISRAYEWGYGHYFIWAAAAAVGAGVAIGIDVVTDHAKVGLEIAGWSVAIPAAIYIFGIWVLHDVPRPQSRARMALSPVAIVLLLVAPLTPFPILVSGLIVVGLLAAKIATSGDIDGAAEAGGS